MSVITLLTDFGTADWFVGAMKGVILRINPRVQIVDITHDLPPGAVRAGAFALAASYRYFPAQTIHVAVVDPGVGGPRDLLAIETAHYQFLGPDNGVLSLAVANEKVRAVHCVTEKRLFLRPVSQTFHGRDILAPVAAQLTKGLAIRRVGPKAGNFVQLDWPRPKIRRTSSHGEIIHIDRFGNAITNLDDSILAHFDLRRCELMVKSRLHCPIRPSYHAVPVGKPVAVCSSSGLLEIAVNRGSAAEMFRLKVGDPVVLRRPRRHSSSSR